MASTAKYSQNVDNRYLVRTNLPREFSTYKELLEYQNDEKLLDDKKEGLSKEISDAMIKAMPVQFTKGKNRDTSLGGNDAINCFYQFNADDDIIPKINRIKKNPYKGLGRVYNEVFDEQQQFLHISFGIADFTSIKKFYEAMIDVDLSKLMNTGKYSLSHTLGSLVAKAAFIPIALPFIASKWAIDLLSAPGITAPSKYYDFRPTMSLYYKMVNVILAHLAVNMGLTSSSPDGEVANIKDSDYEGVPEILKKYGTDILTILSKKHRFDDGDYKPMATDEYFNLSQQHFDAETEFIGTAVDLAAKAADKVGNWAGGVIENFLVGGKYGLTEALKYVSFRIEKGTDTSESGSNSTKESSLSQTINSKIQEAKTMRFNLSGLKSMGGVGKMVGALEEGLSGLIEGTTSMLGIHGGTELAKGAGLIDIPEVWDSSSFTKSYSFNFQLRTPYADKISIFYSLYVPLAMLIAGAFPRAIGPNAHTSPFIVRAYAKGQFAIPLGIIDSITITRGAAEYGWSKDMLPTCLDISFTIKDLSPLMSISLADGNILSWKNIMGQNSSMQEYMLTLSGTGLAERTLAFKLLKKRAKTLLRIATNNKWNPRMMAFSIISGSRGGLLATAFAPTRLPGS